MNLELGEVEVGKNVARWRQSRATERDRERPSRASRTVLVTWLPSTSRSERVFAVPHPLTAAAAAAALAAAAAAAAAAATARICRRR